MEVMDFSLRLFELLFTSPLKVLPVLDRTLSRLLRTLYKSRQEVDQMVRILICVLVQFSLNLLCIYKHVHCEISCV